MPDTGKKYTVIMAVMNGLEGDSRVRKIAASLDQSGIGVLLVGCRSKGTDTKILEFFIEGFPVRTIMINIPSRMPKNMNSADFHQTQKAIFAEEIAKLVEEHEPQIFHSHDYALIGVGARIKARFFRSNLIWFHDLHEWMEGLTNIDPERYDRALAEERDSIHRADALFTVSPQVGDIYIKTYGPARPPTVLLNTPRFNVPNGTRGDIRTALSLGTNAPLGVYSGVVGATRALHEFVPVLARFPDLHLAFVTNNAGEYIESLKRLAAEANAADRIHFHPYIPPDELPKFISTATFGFHSLQHYGNGEVAMPNKLFEYIHAGIPVVASDVAAMKEFVNEHHCGVTFEAGDIDSIANAVHAVMDSNGSYRPSRELAERYSWEEQERKLLTAYAPFLKP